MSYNRSKGSKDSAGDRQGFKKTPWISPPFTSEIGVDIKNQPNNQDLVILGGQSLADDKGTPFLPI